MIIVVQDEDIIPLRCIAPVCPFFIGRSGCNETAVFFPEVQNAVNSAPFRDRCNRVLKLRVFPCLLISGEIRIQIILSAAHLNQIKCHMTNIILHAKRQSGKRQFRIIIAENDLIVICLSAQFIESGDRRIQRVILFQFGTGRFVL